MIAIHGADDYNNLVEEHDLLLMTGTGEDQAARATAGSTVDPGGPAEAGVDAPWSG